MRFPRIIHLVYGLFSENEPEMPAKWAENKKAWAETHPKWTVKLWDWKKSKALIEEVDPGFWEKFTNYKHGVQRADAIRPYILQKEGGVYADLDTSPARSLEPLLQMYDIANTEVVLATSTHSAQPTNSFMMSAKGSRFWPVFISEMKKRASKTYGGTHLTVFNTTGPSLLEHVYTKYTASNPGVVVAIPGALLDTSDICHPEKLQPSVEFITDDHAGSWNESDSDFYNSLYCVLRPLKTMKFVHLCSGVVLTFLMLLGLAYFLHRCRKRCKI